MNSSRYQHCYPCTRTINLTLKIATKRRRRYSRRRDTTGGQKVRRPSSPVTSTFHSHLSSVPDH